MTDITEFINYNPYCTPCTYIKKCKHYNTKLIIYAECCNKYYDCKKCHNEVNPDHKVKNKNIKKIKCLRCNTENPYGNFCYNCCDTISKYSCLKCGLWNDKKINYYHCNKCGLCKLGNENEMFHCDKCKKCFDIKIIDYHNCSLYSENNNCPLCLEILGNKNIKVLKCGHVLHYECLVQLLLNSTNKKCCICRKEIL